MPTVLPMKSRRARSPMLGDALELRVTLLDVEPAIWRRLRVPADVTLAALHEVLQVAFGWRNCHLHEFGELRFGMPDVGSELFSVDERGAPLGAVVREGSKFVYGYDLGDNWEHEIAVERLVEGEDAIACTGGARACPPEDCGGSDGYAHLLEVLASPRDEEYADMKRWVGPRFDPERFDLAGVNKRLAAVSKRARRGRA